MTEHLVRDLDKIKRHVVGMAGLAEEALGLAVHAFTQREEVPARTLAKTEARIDQAQLDIDDEIIKCLALHQPVASDLRFVTMAMRIVNDLERIGDLATSIADRLLFIVNRPPLGEAIDIESMMKTTTKMLHDGLNSFVNLDSALALSVLKLDDLVDDQNRAHFDILISRMQKDSDSVEVAVALLSISRAVERIADLATNIAEDVIFMVEAKDVRHPGL